VQTRILGLLAAGMVAGSIAASAAPITYTFTATGPTPGSLPTGGSLGTLAFGANDVITFTFVGDTADVLSFTFPVIGHEILAGTASVTVTDLTTHAVLAQGTFLSSDAMFVSVDNVNGGIGFGSAGVVPTDPNFPGDPAYPLGIFAANSYDLQSAFSTTGDAIACVGFPGTCVTPIALATTAGDLIMSPDSGYSATFTATLGTTPVPEPATLGLLMFGFAGLAFVRRRGAP
jgi:PEP-CTERM motif